MKTLRLNEIVIGERHRKDLGDIDALAKSIEEIGLLHPVVVLPDNTLVVGERRLAAFKQLGRTEIPVNVAGTLADVGRFVQAECEENTCRKEFTPEEGVKIGERIETIASEEAAGRKRAGQKSGGRGKKKNSGGNSPKVSSAEMGKAAAVAARAVGMDRRTYEKAKETIKAARKNPAKYGKLLEEMNRTGKVNGAHKKLKTSQTAEAINSEPPPLPTGPFRVIVLDPPWSYSNRADDPSHRAANPYPSLTIDKIREMDIQGMAHKDCALWLWTTNAHMREAFSILDAWGFTHKTILTWVKDRFGTGDWLRGQTEHCLLAVRGKPTVTLSNQSTVVNGPLREHSRKPDEFYAMVESLCPGSKVELFARTTRPGWTPHGAERAKFNA